MADTNTARPRALAALFPGLARGEFARTYFPNRPLMVHGPLARLGALARDPRLLQPEAMIEAADSSIVLGYLTSASGRRHQAQLTKATAQELYKDGLTVDAGNLQLTVPAIARWAGWLRAELGLRPDQVICDGIISPRGDAVPMHFDGIETLTVQLTGAKQWTVAPCPEAAFPEQSLFPQVAQNFRDGAYTPSYFPKTRPRRMPKKARRFILRPGSVSFLPRGWWHQTRALEPSISLSFVLRTETWASVLTRELALTPAWRAPVPFATAAQRRFARQEVADFLERWSAPPAEQRVS